MSTRGGLFPRWHPMGGELFYIEESSLMAVEIADEGGFRSGVPERLFEGPYVATLGGWGGFGVAPDGERFLLWEQAIDVRRGRRADSGAELVRRARAPRAGRVTCPRLEPRRPQVGAPAR